MKLYRAYPLATEETVADSAIDRLRSDFSFQCPIEYLSHTFTNSQAQLALVHLRQSNRLTPSRTT